METHRSGQGSGLTRCGSWLSSPGCVGHLWPGASSSEQAVGREAAITNGGNPDGAGKAGTDGDLGPSSLPPPAPVLQVSCLSTEVPHQAQGQSGGSRQGEGEPLLARLLPDAQASQQTDVIVGERQECLPWPPGGRAHTSAGPLVPFKGAVMVSVRPLLPGSLSE